MFYKFVIDTQLNLFEELANSTVFDDVAYGRQGAVLVDCKENLVPIVRTTTTYDKPAQKFLPIHHSIINKIKTASSNPQLEFNNALIEIYNSNYCRMKYHSDQALDLAPNSFICLFSCYDCVNPKDIRKLRVKQKGSNKEEEILLTPGSCVLFSLETNSQFLHQIVLDKRTTNNRWLGITFRLSKTLIQFVNTIPRFYSNNRVLRIATGDERKEYIKYRSEENKSIGYEYPVIDYTISPSDMMLPIF